MKPKSKAKVKVTNNAVKIRGDEKIKSEPSARDFARPTPRSRLTDEERYENRDQDSDYEHSSALIDVRDLDDASQEQNLLDRD
jgi:hypothetical protein